ncbi:hypothetical protein XA68_16085 [Ophiocordyceps unilateralis]|uniref:Cytochrome P450 n=1 Tax=Ophiocordyceps unilateralis TaxID=268505 RepID=A0A2A9PKV3_OPHUN|nr:hypothetical protein XA68_16085 [Ophiocordyceps unilateralis]
MKNATAESVPWAWSTGDVAVRLSLVFLLSLAALAYPSLMAYRDRKQANSEMWRGTQSPPWIPQRRLLRGLDLAVEFALAVRDDGLIPFCESRFMLPGKSTVQLYLGGAHIYYTWEPVNIKALHDHKTWHMPRDRKVSMASLLGKGVFTTDGAEWQHSREMLRPSFTRSQVAARVDALEGHVSRALARIPRDGSTIDLSDVFFRLILDVGSEQLFGEPVGALCEEGEDIFGHAWERAMATCFKRSAFVPLLEWLPWANTTTKDMKHVFGIVDAHIQKALDRRRLQQLSGKDASGKRHVFLEELVTRTDDAHRIRTELLNLLAAGRNTTASMLSSTFFILGKRPDVWRKLQDDVATLEGRHPSLEQLKRLSYVDAVLRETLRLYPVVPVLSREAAEDTTLPTGGGADGTAPLMVKKGQLVHFNLSMLHRRKDLHGEYADEFRPERWLDDSVMSIHGPQPTWKYLPFGAGARVCMGQQLGMAYGAYIIVRLCQHFDRLEGRDPREWQGRVAETMTSAHGAKVGLYAREGVGE